jgi:hypothetical protein
VKGSEGMVDKKKSESDDMNFYLEMDERKWREYCLSKFLEFYQNSQFSFSILDKQIEMKKKDLRWFCQNCWKKEQKLVTKNFDNDLPMIIYERCDFCKQETHLQKHLLGTKGSDFGWVYCFQYHDIDTEKEKLKDISSEEVREILAQSKKLLSEGNSRINVFWSNRPGHEFDDWEVEKLIKVLEEILAEREGK